MAQLERLEQGIVALDSELNLALKEGDQNKIESLEGEMAVLADAYRRIKAQPQELEKRLNQQEEATDLLSKGAYKKPIEKREYFTGGPRVGGTYEDAILRAEQEREEAAELTKLAAKAMEVPVDRVDVKSGLDSSYRTRLGLMRDDSQRYNYLVEEFGADGGDVRVIPLGPDESGFMVSHPQKTQGKYVLADEYGNTVRDLLDNSRSKAEMGGAMLATIGTTGVIGGAARAGLGTLLTSLGLDMSIGKPDEAEKNFRNNLGYAMNQGSKEAAFDVGAGTFLKLGVKAIDGFKVNRGVDEQFDMYRDAQNYVEGKYGVKFPRTTLNEAGTVEAIMKQEELASLYPSGVFAGIARRTEKARDIIYKLTSTLRGVDPPNFETMYNDWANGLRARHAESIKELKSKDALMGNALERSINRRIELLSGKFGKTTRDDVTGQSVRDSIESTYGSVKDTSNGLYKRLFELADERGVVVNAQEVNKRILKRINGLNLPKDIEGQVLDIFKPSELRQVSRQAEALGGTVEEVTPQILGPRGEVIAGGVRELPGVLPLNYKQLDDYRKEITNLIDRTVKSGGDSSKLKEVQDEIYNIIDSALAKGGDDVVQASKDAKAFWRENVLPFQADDMLRARRMDAAGQYKLKDEALAHSYLSGKDAVGRIRYLKERVGSDSEAMDYMRGAFVNRLLGRSLRSDGTVDLLKLKNVAFDPKIAEELYGKNGVRAFEELAELARVRGMEKITPESVEGILNAKSPEDIRGILEQATELHRAQTYHDKVFSEKLTKSLLEEGSAIPEPIELISAARRLSGPRAKQFMSQIPIEGGMRDAFRQEVLNDLFMQAGRQTSFAQKTSEAIGGKDLWNASLMAKILRNKKQRANLNAILGPQAVKDLEALNRVLSANSKRMVARSKPDEYLQVRAMGGTTPIIMPTGVFRVSMDYIKHRMLSAGYTSGILMPLARKTKNSDELFSRLFPAMLGSKEGLYALTLEADKDPRFEAFINQYISDSPSTEDKK
jgi:hypothetical protein